ncbi:hypothetical protein JGH11_12610 [Dysgonomonas sp. Marseille-P4677]|uniref:hypothetical protein n=1 Tax=Dysgonomonas sp. Marseille-P4677 TaxID=2364790 RepID=UPI001914543B|nr:hypothetical protein [Dysgonomonas sp. Marseille-P4677]MBK5721713.1 hypothetical protein [Dysgonomonas sp. Marseille-P4677]
MKFLKSLLLSTFIITLFTNMYGQSRSSTSALTGQVQSEKLRQAIGWKQDALGEWISNNNAISDIKLNEETMSTVSQNFKWLQFVSFKNKGKDIYALLYENINHIAGSKSEKRIHYYLMDPASYRILVACISQKSGETQTIHSSKYGYMSDQDGQFSADKLLSLISQTLTQDNPGMQYDMSINAQHVDNEDVVRFRLPETSSIMGGKLTDGYFEVKWNDFSKILLPVTASNSDEFDLGLSTTLENNQKNRLGDDNIIDRDVIKSEMGSEPQIDNYKQQSIEQITQDTLATADVWTDRHIKEKAIVSSPIASLSNIEGWYLTQDGEWVNDKNLLYNFETVGRYEIRNFNYHKKAYILLTRYEKYAGATYFLISKDEYVKIIDELDQAVIIKFPVIVTAGIGNKLEDMIELCEETIDAPVNSDAIIFKTNYIVLQYRLSQTKNLARFFLFEQDCSRYGSETSTESCNIKVSNKIRYDDEHLLMTDDLFGKMYYESTYNDFMNFFRSPQLSKSVDVTKSKSVTGLEDRY